MSDERPAPPPGEPVGFPALTVISSLAVLLLFGVAGVALYRELEARAPGASAPAAEEALRKLTAEQEAALARGGRDEANQAWTMPVRDAMRRIARQKGATP